LAGKKMKSPENFENTSIVANLENKEISELDKLLREIAEKLVLQGIPVNSDARIDMEQYESFFSSDIDSQKEFLSNRDKVSRLGVMFKKDQLGEKFEKMKTIVFHKFLSEQFVVCRTSSFDDIENKIDNIILERESGNLVCAMDEVMDESGERFVSKRDKIREKNLKGGAMLKYSLKMSGRRVEKTLRTKKLPLFHLALSKEKVLEWLKAPGSDIETISANEEEIFAFFLEGLSKQADELLREEKLNEQLKGSILKFKDSLIKLQKKNV
jgi:hypothetical protein